MPENVSGKTEGLVSQCCGTALCPKLAITSLKMRNSVKKAKLDGLPLYQPLAAVKIYSSWEFSVLIYSVILLSVSYLYLKNIIHIQYLFKCIFLLV